MEIQIDTRLRSDIITAKKGGELHMPVIYSTPELGPDEGRVIRQIENIKSRIKSATKVQTSPEPSGASGVTFACFMPRRGSVSS